MILLQNFAGSKQKSFKKSRKCIIGQDETIRGLDLAAVRHMSVRVTKMPLNH
jgi:hypothetical protein